MEELRIEAEFIQAYLDITVSNNHEEMAERLASLMSYLSRTAEMLAKAKRILRAKKTSEINNTIISIAKAAHLSASVQNALLDSICEDEAFLVDWIERLNKACTHQMDGLRSLISYDKEELRLRETGY
jgi:hypothetical protein